MQSLPVAMAFSTQLLLTHKTSSPDKVDSSAKRMEPLTMRATRITATLKNIQGYSHGGIND